MTEILDIAEARSLNRFTIDWKSLKEEAFKMADNLNVQSIAGADQVLIYILSTLNDNNSHIVTTDSRWLFGTSSLSCLPNIISTITAPDNVGYIRLPFISEIETNGQASINYATNIQNMIKNQDSQNLKGWVVDLRSTGGNMWPMLAGIGPILGSGVSGYSIEPDNTANAWSYNNGTAFYNQTAKTTLPNPYSLFVANPKVAVLIDSGTASAAEALAISFVGRANTRIFGASTCGLTTYIETFKLSNDSYLELVVGQLADRLKNKFTSKVTPNQVVASDAVANEAFNWINS